MKINEEHECTISNDQSSITKLIMNDFKLSDHYELDDNRLVKDPTTSNICRFVGDDLSDTLKQNFVNRGQDFAGFAGPFSGTKKGRTSKQ